MVMQDVNIGGSWLKGKWELSFLQIFFKSKLKKKKRGQNTFESRSLLGSIGKGLLFRFRTIWFNEALVYHDSGCIEKKTFVSMEKEPKTSCPGN